jgi:aldose 1-epimerase
MAGSRVTREVFGTLPDGRAVERVTLRGQGAFEARIITYGAALQALIAVDAKGGHDDVVLGHDDCAFYLAERKFFGATVGRYANRIAAGRFVLDGKTIGLAVNNGPNALHGGLDGFDRKLWDIVSADDGAEPAVTLAYASADGEEGYPGRLDVRLTYRVTGPSELSIVMEANCDRPTIVNLTNHSFFNLEGATSGTDILDHKLTVAADHFLAIDPTAIPLAGSPRRVDGTPFDFRNATQVGARIRQSDEQLRNGRGYDHTYCFARDDKLRPVARLEAPLSGRVLELLTNQPGLQVYSGNYLDGTISGKGGRLYRQSDAICLEPHIWPNSPNRPDFPSPRLNPGETYRHHTVYRFGVKR